MLCSKLAVQVVYNAHNEGPTVEEGVSLLHGSLEKPRELGSCTWSLLYCANIHSEERARRVSTARTARADIFRRGRTAHTIRDQTATELPTSDASDNNHPEQLAIVIKADVQGTAEAVRDAISSLSSDKVPSPLSLALPVSSASQMLLQGLEVLDTAAAREHTEQQQ